MLVIDQVVDLEDPERHVKVIAFPDDNPEDPRENCYPEAIISTRDDRQIPGNPELYEKFPLYMYKHSGVAFSLNDFHNPWDSCRYGTVYVSKNIRNPREFANNLVEDYENYVNGQVFIIEGYIGEENVDYTFAYGLDNTEAIGKAMFKDLCNQVSVQGRLI